MLKILLSASAVSAALLAGPAAAFTNTSFEDGLTGWNSVGSVSVVSSLAFSDGNYSTNVTPMHGNWMALLTTTGSAPELLWQTASSAPTTQPLVLWYRFLTEDYHPYNDTLSIQYRTLGDTAFFSLKPLNVENSNPDSGWRSVLLPVNTFALKIQLQNQGDALVDSYGLIDIAPVPEPESVAMLLAGLGLMTAFARRRTRKQPAL